VSFFEQQEQRKDKQFISIFDSVSFVSEYGKGTLQQAFDLITSTFLRKQTYLLLITPTTVKAVYVCSSYEQSDCEPYITFESIIHELKMCLDRNSVGTGNPIYKLGFGKKRFVEQLVNLGMQLPEQVIFNTESPDITDADYTSEGDELAFYQGLPKEYDILRAENEKIKAQYQELFNKKGQPEAFYNIQKQLYESSREQLDECKNKLDKLSVNYKNLESDYDYCKRNFESTKKKTALTQQIAEKRISDLENQLAQAKAELADKPANDNTEQDHLYNWQAMDKNQYPPELHLAIEIWKEYYQVDAVKHISQFDAGRFNRITNEFNLSKGNLKSRIRSLLTPLNSKTKSPELLSSLEVISIIHNDKLEQD
jgi:archaellum component FlaC